MRQRQRRSHGALGGRRQSRRRVLGAHIHGAVPGPDVVAVVVVVVVVYGWPLGRAGWRELESRTVDRGGGTGRMAGEDLRRRRREPIAAATVGAGPAQRRRVRGDGRAVVRVRV